MPGIQTAEVLQLVADDILAAQHDDDGKRAELHERIHEQVDQRGFDAARRARHHADEHVAGVRDRRVGQHPFHVRLRERRDVADRHRDDGQRLEQQPPVGIHHRQPFDEDTQQHRERRGLRSDREKRGDRRRRALVHVRRPHVERHRRNLESDARHDQDDRKHEPLVGFLTREERRHHTEIRRAGQPVHQGHAVQQHAERERAEQEILHGRFVRALTRLDEPGENVERHGHRLEADEDGDEIDPAGHDHHAQCGAENQEVVLTRRHALHVDVMERHQHGDGRGQ